MERRSTASEYQTRTVCHHSGSDPHYSTLHDATPQYSTACTWHGHLCSRAGNERSSAYREDAAADVTHPADFYASSRSTCAAKQFSSLFSPKLSSFMLRRAERYYRTAGRLCMRLYASKMRSTPDRVEHTHINLLRFRFEIFHLLHLTVGSKVVLSLGLNLQSGLL